MGNSSTVLAGPRPMDKQVESTVQRTGRSKNLFRSLISKLVPQALQSEAVALRETLIDGWRYQRATAHKIAVEPGTIQERREALLTMTYHGVEKALTLPNPRRPFGLALRGRLKGLLTQSSALEMIPPYEEYARDALRALDTWNGGGEADDLVSPPLAQPASGPTRADLETFFGSRHSVRDFDTSRPPTVAEIQAAVEWARNTPSVCNRQGYRVHFYFDRARIDALLGIQNGAVGFADSVPALAVVTARRPLFVGPMERNQRWVDGGLFAMTLVWALHGSGLASCMLNCAMAARTADRVRAIAGISGDEDIVVMIAIGYPSEGARVARSAKRSHDDLARYHTADPRSAEPDRSDQGERP